jgi:hypothetical protein
LLIALWSIGSFFFPDKQFAFLLLSILRIPAHSFIFFAGQVKHHLRFALLFLTSPMTDSFKRTVSFQKRFFRFAFLMAVSTSILSIGLPAVTYTSALTEVRLFSADDFFTFGPISPLPL